MRHVFLAALLCLIVATAVQAQDSLLESKANAPANRVQLVEDDENGALRIVIDGKQVARIDAAGAHIAGDLAYTGTIADVGAPAAAGPDDAP